MKQIKDISGFEDLDIAGEEVNSEVESSAGEPQSEIIPVQDLPFDNSWWEKFEADINDNKSRARGQRVFCKLDSDLGYTLDECKIGGASRSDMVNSIVRTFITGHIEQFKANRKSKKTLL